MDVCPKCGRKLKLTNLKPICPGCGVNLLYYKIEERLEVDAINAELEHAKTQQRVDRAKASMVGSAFTIARIVLLVLVVGMLFLPLATLHVQGPLFDKTTTINALELYNGVSGMDFDGFIGLLGSQIFGQSMLFFTFATVCVILAAVCALLELIFSFLSCSPHGFSRNVFLSVLGIVTSIISIIFYNMFISSISVILPGVIGGTVGVGVYCVIVAFVLVLAINIVIKIKGVDIKYKTSYVDSIPYDDFVTSFGNGKYDLDKLEENREILAKYKAKYAEDNYEKEPEAEPEEEKAKEEQTV